MQYNNIAYTAVLSAREPKLFHLRFQTNVAVKGEDHQGQHEDGTDVSSVIGQTKVTIPNPMKMGGG
jgi:hypothetical protein